jgi:predicted RNase H-like nuclease
MYTCLRSEVFPHIIFSDDEFDFERSATPSDAPGRKRLKALSRLGSVAAEDRGLGRAHSLSVALDEEKRSLRRSSSISANANAGKRALVREVRISRPLRSRASLPSR